MHIGVEKAILSTVKTAFWERIYQKCTLVDICTCCIMSSFKCLHLIKSLLLCCSREVKKLACKLSTQSFEEAVQHSTLPLGWAHETALKGNFFFSVHFYPRNGHSLLILGSFIGDLLGVMHKPKQICTWNSFLKSLLQMRSIIISWSRIMHSQAFLTDLWCIPCRNDHFA